MNRNYNVVFFGTPLFAAEHLSGLIGSGAKVVGVVSRPDRPSGRGRKLVPTPVKEVALKNGIDIIQPGDTAEKEVVVWLKEKKPWLIVTVAYGRIIPREILELPESGAWNVHASLLPRWRGAAPINRAIQHGESKTGITLMQMDEGLDTGDILMSSETDIGPNETAGELRERLMKMGRELLVRGLEEARKGRLTATPQDPGKATYAPPITKDETFIDWNLPAGKVHNFIRAFSPLPAARSGDLKIIRSRLGDGRASGEAGTIKDIRKGLLEMNTGVGTLEIIELQPPGKKVMNAADYARGRHLAPGDRI